MKILFVCLGNICRSPAAEGLFLSVLKEHGLERAITVDSAGTSAFHAGELPDPRMREHALNRGVKLTSRARQFISEDFKIFDYILVMDKSNYRNVTALDPEGNYHEKVLMMTSFCQRFQVSEVPDPYYGGPEGFDHVLDILEDSSRQLIEKLKCEIG